MRKQIMDLTGQRFGKLVVLHLGTRTACNRVRWVCQCDCGNITEVQANDLRRGVVVSCGCYGRSIGGIRNKIHGDAHKSRLHNIWCGMRQRCHNKNHPYYKDYGGRGIYVCKEWDDYLVFKEWALSNGYAENLTIERIDNNAGYNPDNCTWITRSEQRKNQRRNIMYKGKCLKYWTNLLGLSYYTIKSRIYRGVDIETALTAPLKERVK